MHILSVISHPNPNSFSHAVLDRFNQGVREAGCTVEVADLHAEGFNPCWSMPDLAQFKRQPMPPDVLAEQARIDRCDALCLVFPLFWFGMPAMLKGWLDRVWSWGWAYDDVGDHDKSLQRSRIGVLLVPAGGAPQSWEPYGLDQAMDTIWKTGTLGYLGITDKRIHMLNGSVGSRPRREGLLERAYQVGLSITEPQTGNC